MLNHYITASSEGDDNGLNTCQFHCGYAGDLIGIKLQGVEVLFNIITIVYQHLNCPADLYGPGCEMSCECSERETCHYIKGCYIGEFNWVRTTSPTAVILLFAMM